MRGTPTVVRAVLTVVVGAAAACYVLTDSDLLANACYLGVLVGAGVGAWLGARRAPRGQRLVPRLIAAGISLSALGDITWVVLDAVGIGTDVSLADPAWVGSYLLLCGALWALLVRTHRDDAVVVEFVIDAVTIVIVSVLVFWTISVATIVADDSVSPLVRAMWAAYPIADAVLLALVVRVLTSRRARGAMGGTFGVGVVLWLAADVLYLLAPGEGALMAVMDLAWMVAPVLLATAAWRARDAGVDTAAPAEPAGHTTQVLIAVGPLVVPPLVEVLADLRGASDQPVRLLLASAALIALAFVRTARLMHSEQRAHAALAEARDDALEASRAKSMFVANVSHEIRTPLTTVLATAELLEDTELDPVQLRLVEKMRRSGGLLRSLVEEVLDFSQIEAGQVELAQVAFDLHALAAEVAEVHVAQASAAGLGIEWEVAPGTPRHVVGDPVRVFQVLSNLLDNAVKFTHEGRVRLQVRPLERGAGVELAVEDTGIGIGEDDLGSIFDSFRQVDGSATRHYEGSGLGLAICRDLTELMGGSLTVSSTPRSGSTFRVRLPLAGPGGREPDAGHGGPDPAARAQVRAPVAAR